jgi:hypothetical protein
VILFRSNTGPEGSLWTLSLGDKKIAPFGGVRSSDPTDAVFSPDGRWVAYGRTDQGATRIYVQPFPATGATYQLSAAGSPHHPVWSAARRSSTIPRRRDSRSSASQSSQPMFAFGNPVAVPKVLLMGPPALRRSYDITPDGRFVGLVNPGEASSSTNQQLSVILNWFGELKARVPNR